MRALPTPRGRGTPGQPVKFQFRRRADGVMFPFADAEWRVEGVLRRRWLSPRYRRSCRTGSRLRRVVGLRAAVLQREEVVMKSRATARKHRLVRSRERRKAVVLSWRQRGRRQDKRYGQALPNGFRRKRDSGSHGTTASRGFRALADSALVGVRNGTLSSETPLSGRQPSPI